jgi:hypothetical protein
VNARRFRWLRSAARHGAVDAPAAPWQPPPRPPWMGREVQQGVHDPAQDPCGDPRLRLDGSGEKGRGL